MEELLKRFEEVVRENERLKEELRSLKEHPYSVSEQLNPLYRPWYINHIPNTAPLIWCSGAGGALAGNGSGSSTITVNPGMATQTTLTAKF